MLIFVNICVKVQDPNDDLTIPLMYDIIIIGCFVQNPAASAAAQDRLLVPYEVTIYGSYKEDRMPRNPGS